jgi:hypothetical protein
MPPAGVNRRSPRARRRPAHLCDLSHVRRETIGLTGIRAEGIGGRRMDAIANFLFRTTGSNLDDETVQIIVVFCGIGLFVLLLFVAYGLDLCPRFF